MDFDVPRTYELFISHDAERSGQITPSICNAWVIDESLNLAFEKIHLSFESILRTLEEVVGLSDCNLITIMDEYVKFGFSRLRFISMPAKLRSAGLLAIPGDGQKDFALYVLEAQARSGKGSKSN